MPPQIIHGLYFPIFERVWSPSMPIIGSVNASINLDISMRPETTMELIPKISV